MPHLTESSRLLLGHPVQHLQFEGPFGNFQFLGTGQCMSQAAHVVAAECGPQQGVVLQQSFRQAFVAVVRLPLLFEDRDWPVTTGGNHRFVVPIGPFDQAHPDWCSSFAGPFQQPRQISLRISQIGLNDNSDIAHLAEFVFHQGLLEDVEGQVFVRILFHVDMHIGMLLAGLPQQWSQASLHCIGCSGGVSRSEMADEGRKLDRNVHAGKRTVVIGIDSLVFRPGVDHRGQSVD